MSDSFDFMNIINQLPEVIYILNDEAIVLFRNHSAEKLFRYKSGSTSNKQFINYLHQEEIDYFKEKFIELLNKQGFECTIEFRHKQGNKDWIWCEATMKNCLEDKQINGVLITIRDISAKKNQESDLGSKMKDYKKLVETLEDSLVQANNDGIVTLANHAAVKFFEFDSPEEMLGCKLTELYADPDERKKLLSELKEKGVLNNYEVIIRTKKNKKRWTSSSIKFIRNSENEIVGTEGLIRDISELKNSQARLKENEFKLRQQNQVFNTFLDNLTLGVFMVEAPTGKPLLINKAAYDILGRGIMQDTNKKNLSEMYSAYKEETNEPYPPEEMPVIRSMSGEESYIDDMIIETDSGERKNIEVYGSPVFDDSGKTWASIATFTDISKRKKTEEKLHKSQRTLSYINGAISKLIKLKELNDIFQFAPKVVHDLFPESLVIFISVDESKNDTILEAIAGINNTQLAKLQEILNINLIGRHYKLQEKYRAIFKTEKLKKYEGGFAEFMAGEFPNRIIKAVQKILRVNDVYSIGLNFNEQIFGAIHILSRNKETEPEFDFIENLFSQLTSVIYNKILNIRLQESEYTLRTYINSTSDIVFTLDNKLRHTGIFGDWVEKVGMKESDFIGKTTREIIGDIAGIHEEAFQKVLKGEFCVYEWSSFIDTEKAYYQTALSPIYRNNTITGIIGVGRDITKLKLTEENLRESNATKDKFFSIVAHDLKSPFNTIMGFSELLIDNLHNFDRQEIKDIVSNIYNASDNTYKLTKNLLDWSLSQTGMIKFEPANYKAESIVRKAIKSVSISAQAKNIHIENEIPKNIDLYCDPDMIETILRNLLSNSIKFSYHGGLVKISAQKQDQVTILAVKDKGIGISKIDMSRLFRIEEKVSREGTDNEKGTGLGLLICKEFIEKHKGKIWVESKINKGSCFYFSITDNSAWVN